MTILRVEQLVPDDAAIFKVREHGKIKYYISTLNYILECDNYREARKKADRLGLLNKTIIYK